MSKYITLLKDRWKFAQEKEASCWDANQTKVSSEEYQILKKEYWRRVLDKVLSETSYDSKKILDFGCGPSGLVLYFTDEIDLTCMDPLMSFYLNEFPYLKDRPFRYINEAIESYTDEDTFDYIFGFNAIDHVKDIRKSLKNLTNLMTEDGFLVLSINVHEYSSIQFLLNWTNIIFDRLHPHQYTGAQYKALLMDAGFEVVEVISIDEEARWINSQTRSEKESIPLVQYLDPSKVLFNVLKLLGISRYGLPGEKKVYSHVVFIAKLQK